MVRFKFMLVNGDLGGNTYGVLRFVIDKYNRYDAIPDTKDT